MDIHAILRLLSEWEAIERPFLPEREVTLESLAYLILEWTTHLLDEQRTRMLRPSCC
jgi:hypothetical protein